MGMLILSIPCHLLNNMITDDTHYHLFNIISSAGPEMKRTMMMEPLMGMLILSIPCHLFNDMIADDTH